MTKPDGYDSRDDVMAHKARVEFWLNGISSILRMRAAVHDDSKLQDPEKATFDKFTWRLKQTEFGSAEYQEQLVAMGAALQHHYSCNRHHPEHFPNGVDGMTLIDLIEMFVDWLAACEAKGVPINLDMLSKRFGIGDQLGQILANTIAAGYAPRTPNPPDP